MYYAMLQQKVTSTFLSGFIEILFNNLVYTCIIPDQLKVMSSIVHFEATNILLAVRCSAESWTDAIVVIWCDNRAVVNAFTHNKICDNILMATGYRLPNLRLT